jgi:hypothetical protein
VANRDEPERRAHAPALLENMIDVLSKAPRQDFAKDQILRAIKAIWRNDTGSAGLHLTLAMRDVPHAPVDISWNDLRDRVAKLRRGYAED